VLSREKPFLGPLGEPRVNLDPDVAAAQLGTDDTRGRRSRERIQHQVAGIAGGSYDPAEQLER
jgi:hypothetical protein